MRITLHDCGKGWTRARRQGGGLKICVIGWCVSMYRAMTPNVPRG